MLVPPVGLHVVVNRTDLCSFVPNQVVERCQVCSDGGLVAVRLQSPGRRMLLSFLPRTRWSRLVLRSSHNRAVEGWSKSTEDWGVFGGQDHSARRGGREIISTQLQSEVENRTNVYLQSRHRRIGRPDFIDLPATVPCHRCTVDVVADAT